MEELSILSHWNLTLLSEHIVHLENVGPVHVYVQGDLDRVKTRESVFLSLHGVGSSHQDWVTFFNHEDMQETRDRLVISHSVIIIIIITFDRSLIVHVSLPGQQKEAEDIDQFPSMAR